MHFSERKSEMVRDVVSSWALYLQLLAQQGDAVTYLVVYHLPQLFDSFNIF